MVVAGDAAQGEVEAINVGAAAGGDQHPVGLHHLVAGRAGDRDAQARAGAIDALNLRVGNHTNALARQHASDRVGHLRFLVAHERRAGEDRDVASEVREQLAELERDVAAADHRQPRRHPPQVKRTG